MPAGMACTYKRSERLFSNCYSFSKGRILKTESVADFFISTYSNEIELLLRQTIIYCFWVEN